MKVKVLSAISSVGWSGRKYGPFEADQIVDLPSGLVQRLVKQGLVAEPIEEPEEKKIDPQTESRMRRIAKTQGYDEEAFLREYGRLISEGQSDMDALSSAMKLFEKGAKTEKRPTLATFAPGHLEEPTPELREGKPGTAAEPGRTPRTTKEVGGGAGPRIDPELIGWLVQHGFTRGPEGVALSKQDKVGEKIVKLVVNFGKNPRGARFAYVLNLEKDPPEWENAPAYRDHQDLLSFKGFRDKLFAQRERTKSAPPPAPPKAKLTEVPAGGGTKLALLPPEAEEAMEKERRDEQMIIRELKGDLKVLERALADYFYSFELRGRKVIGLSYSGVKAVIRRMGHIAILEIKVEEKAKSWFVLVKAHDKLKDLEAYGAAIQPKQFLGGGENPYSLTVAVSKAQRNAWRHFIDEKIVTETYRAWLKGRGVGGEK